MQTIKQTIKKKLPASVLTAYYILRQKVLANCIPTASLTENKADGNYALDFNQVFDENLFENDESVSGAGSTLDQTAVLRQALPPLLKQLETRVLLDVPCGDFNWMQHVDFSDFVYIGGDIVEKLIELNNARFSNVNRSFLKLNLVSDPLPEADIIFCRDCLVHLNFEQCRNVIQNIKRSKARYLLTTTFSEHMENVDLTSGIWRTLNLQAAPFNFPEPVFLLNEKCTEANNQFSDKCIGAWKVADLPEL